MMEPGSEWSHDIRDPERFVAKIVNRSRRQLNYHQRERLQQFLLIALWEISRDFRPGGILFSTFAGNTLPRRIIDWERTPEEGGRTLWTKPRSGSSSKQYAESYERTRPQLISLERELSMSGVRGESGAGDVVGRELADAFRRESLDSSPDRSPDLMRVLGEGGRNHARAEHKMGKGKTRRAA